MTIVRGFALATFSLGAACTSITELPMPELAGQSFLLVIAEHDSERYTVIAGRSADGPSRALAGFVAGEDLDLYYFGYSCALEALGLSEGTHPVDLATAHRAVELPGLLGAQHAHVRGGDAASWTALAEVPEEVDAALRALPWPERFATCPAAGGYELARVSVAASLRSAVALEDGSVLAGTSGGAFFRLSPAGVEPLPAMMGLPSAALFRAADGVVWLFGKSGEVARGRLESGFESITGPFRAYPAGQIVIDGPRTADEPFQIFSVDDHLQLGLFDGARWSALTRDNADPYSARSMGVLWRGRDRAFAFIAGPSTTTLVEATSQPGDLAEFAQEHGGTISSAADLPGLGPTLLDYDGNLFSWEGKSITSLSEGPGFGVAPEAKVLDTFGPWIVLLGTLDVEQTIAFLDRGSGEDCRLSESLLALPLGAFDTPSGLVLVGVRGAIFFSRRAPACPAGSGLTGAGARSRRAP